MGRVLSERALGMLADLPPVLRESHDYQAVIVCYANEFDRLDGVIEQVRAQFTPSGADLMLGDWERQTRLPVGGGGATVDQRRASVEGRLKRMKGTAEGRAWEQDLDDILGPGWDYREHDPADVTSPPDETILVVMPFPADSPRFAQAAVDVREVTPAHLALQFGTTGGFVLDISQLDTEEMD